MANNPMGGGGQRRARPQNMGQVHPEVASALSHIGTFQSPKVTQTEIDNIQGMGRKDAHARVNKRAQAAQAIRQIASDPNADPQARQLAQDAINTQSIDRWMELYDLNLELRQVGKITGDHAYKKIDDTTMNTQLTQLQTGGLTPIVSQTADEYKRLGPLVHQFERDKKQTPEMKYKAYKANGQVVKVDNNTIQDTNGTILFRTPSGSDPRNLDLMANQIVTGALDSDIDPQKAQQIGQQWAGIRDATSQYNGRLYDHVVQRMGGLPMGQITQQSFQQEQLQIQQKKQQQLQQQQQQQQQKDQKGVQGKGSLNL